MSKVSAAYDGQCPSCGRVFTLADLRRMAVGDGAQRWLWAKMPDGAEQIVSFDDFNPATMTAIAPKSGGNTA